MEVNYYILKCPQDYKSSGAGGNPNVKIYPENKK
jgi:hypothetical protein